jgi:intracellular sulfur oxidation DsrE/DsrF family protein
MDKKMKVLLHVNENERWTMALGNATNFLKDVGQDVADVVIVVNGPAVSSYGSSDHIDTMDLLADKGVQFKACRNTLKKLCSEGTVCISEETLPDFVEVVPAGISEIVRKQREGYAYVKP